MEPAGPGHATRAPASVAIDHAVDLMSQQEMCHEAVSERTFELPCTFPTVGPAITKPPDRLFESPCTLPTVCLAITKPPERLEPY